MEGFLCIGRGDWRVDFVRGGPELLLVRSSCGGSSKRKMYRSRHQRRVGGGNGMLYMLALHAASKFMQLPRKPPVTASLILANTVVYLRPGVLDVILPTVDEVCLSPYLVLQVCSPALPSLSTRRNNSHSNDLSIWLCPCPSILIIMHMNVELNPKSCSGDVQAKIAISVDGIRSERF